MMVEIDQVSHAYIINDAANQQQPFSRVRKQTRHRLHLLPPSLQGALIPLQETFLR